MPARPGLPDGSNPRVSAVAPYREPETLRTMPIPGGGQARLERLSPRLGGEAILRWIAEFKVGRSQHTIERYVQSPWHGSEDVALEATEIAIQIDLEQLLERVAVRRKRAGYA